MKYLVLYPYEKIRKEKIMTPEEIEVAVKVLVEGSILGKYNGVDNYKNPKTNYLKKIISMDDDQLLKECKDKIWLSAYAGNNPRSDYHWHCDACYDEFERRGKLELYKKAWEQASGSR